MTGGCATTASRTAQTDEPIPGYLCQVRLDDRKTSDTWLRADGSVFRSQWEWNWRSDFETGLTLWVTHRTGPDLIQNTFPVSVITSEPFTGNRRRPVRARIGLTNRAGTDWLSFQYAIAKSDPPRRGLPSRSLWIGWSDLVAYAEGSPTLYLLTLDTKDNSVTSRAFPRDLILDADAEIAAMAKQMEAKIADRANRCEALDDIDPPLEILV